MPRRDRIGIGDAQRQFVLQQHPAAGLQRAEHTTVLAMGVAGLQAAEVGGALLRRQTASRLPALQREQRACRLRRSSEPPWFLGMMGATDRARWYSRAPQHSQRPLARVSTRYLIESLIGVRCRLQWANTSSPRCARKASRRWRQSSSNSSRSLSLKLYCCAEAFGYAAHQGVGALFAAGDAVAREHLAHHELDAFGGVIDLDHVFRQDPGGYVLRLGRTAASQELHEHQGLVNVAHAHALGDGVA